MVALRPWMHNPDRPHHRVVVGLDSACKLSSRPENIPIPRTRGVKAEGRRFEKAAGKMLSRLKLGGSLESSVWFEFFDANGRGVCEVDHIILRPDRVVVVECKLTQTPRAFSQLERLYLPVVRKIFSQVPVQGVMVCKRLYEVPTDLATSWEEVLAMNASIIPTWHWLGR